MGDGCLDGGPLTVSYGAITAWERLKSARRVVNGTSGRMYVRVGRYVWPLYIYVFRFASELGFGFEADQNHSSHSRLAVDTAGGANVVGGRIRIFAHTPHALVPRLSTSATVIKLSPIPTNEAVHRISKQKAKRTRQPRCAPLASSRETTAVCARTRRRLIMRPNPGFL